MTETSFIFSWNKFSKSSFDSEAYPRLFPSVWKYADPLEELLNIYLIFPFIIYIGVFLFQPPFWVVILRGLFLSRLFIVKIWNRLFICPTFLGPLCVNFFFGAAALMWEKKAHLRHILHNRIDNRLYISHCGITSFSLKIFSIRCFSELESINFWNPIWQYTVQDFKILCFTFFFSENVKLCILVLTKVQFNVWFSLFPLWFRTQSSR